MKKLDYKLLFAVIIISLFGVLMIYSASSIWAEYKFNDSFRYLKLQLIFFIISLVIMFIVTKIDYMYYYKKANIILMICFLLLCLVLIPGLGVVRNGSRSWFNLGFISIQPSEFMKLSLIIFTSKYLSNNSKYINNIKLGILPILSVTLISFILIMLEPDLGTGFIILITTIGLLFVSGVRLSFFYKIFLLGLIGLSSLIIIAPYRLQRIVSFIDPFKDPLGTGFQAIQSMYAISPSGLFGRGLFNSIQKQFYLPEPQTDFIFSIISEELGILGAFIVLGLFIFIIYRMVKICLKTNDLYSKYLSFGIIFQLSIQIILNLGVVTGIFPITGVTLPFLSYGGSSLLITFISIGIILNISKHNV